MPRNDSTNSALTGVYQLENGMWGYYLPSFFLRMGEYCGKEPAVYGQSCFIRPAA